jgi:hypothetical protein
MLPGLPIDEVLPRVVAALRGASGLVLVAPTGAGLDLLRNRGWTHRIELSRRLTA